MISGLSRSAAAYLANAFQRALTSRWRTTLAMTAATWRHPSWSFSLTGAPSSRMPLTSALAVPFPSVISGQSFCPAAARLMASRPSALSIRPAGNSTERLRSAARSASTAAHSSIRSRSRSHHGFASPLMTAQRKGSIQLALAAARCAPARSSSVCASACAFAALGSSDLRGRVPGDSSAHAGL
jgi:hypothetical protein